MNFFIDESGSFVGTPSSGAWNVVVAYASPEGEKRRVARCVQRLKRVSGYRIKDEVKLGDIGEEEYLKFLRGLGCLDGVVFAVATDAGNYTAAEIMTHQKLYVQQVHSNIEKMKRLGGREAIKFLAQQLAGLSSQLYAQLFCQVDLFFLT